MACLILFLVRPSNPLKSMKNHGNIIWKRQCSALTRKLELLYHFLFVFLEYYVSWALLTDYIVWITCSTKSYHTEDPQRNWGNVIITPRTSGRALGILEILKKSFEWAFSSRDKLKIGLFPISQGRFLRHSKNMLVKVSVAKE